MTLFKAVKKFISLLAKSFPYVILLIIFFGTFSFSLYLYLTRPLNEVFPIPETRQRSEATPTRLVIPAINVTAEIQPLGLTSKGEIEVPDNISNVGWFKLGPRPGEIGDAVIAGHFDGKRGESGVFSNLYQLKEGDEIYIDDDKGSSISFVVRKSRTYKPGYAEEVFNATDSAHLNLITCDGVWDGAKKSYTKRLVIFADIKNQSLTWKTKL